MSRSATALNSPSQDEGSPAHDDGPPGQDAEGPTPTRDTSWYSGPLTKHRRGGRASRPVHRPAMLPGPSTRRTTPPACRRGLAAPGHAAGRHHPSPRLLPGCHSARDDGPELRQRSPVHTEIALALARVSESTDRLLATADALTDAQAAAASRLTGWTRGHVLTHLARNADGFRNLLAWAATGDETPMYPSEEARDRAIETGAGRPAAELAADLRERRRARGGEGPGPRLGTLVARRGERFPARGDPAAAAVRAGDPSRRPGRGYRQARLAATSWRRTWSVARDFAYSPGTLPPAPPARTAWTPPSRSARTHPALAQLARARAVR
jgi:uncharacterized protein (TIGR03083 family)